MTNTQLSTAEAVQLSDLVDYQDGSIVSRQLLNSATGSLTLFAFDDGEQLSEHTTPSDALVQIVDGEAEIHIGGRPSVLAAGQVILLPANVPHAVFARGRFKMLLTMLHS